MGTIFHNWDLLETLLSFKDAQIESWIEAFAAAPDTPIISIHTEFFSKKTEFFSKPKTPIKKTKNPKP